MRRKNNIPWILAAAAFAAAGVSFVPAAFSEPETAPFRLVAVAEKLDSPWGLAFLPGGGFLVTEKPGNLVAVSRTGEKTRIAGVPPVASGGQGGLLDVALHPGFPDNKLIYLSYSAPGPGQTSGTAVLRARLDGGRLQDSIVIFEMRKKTSSTHHYGSRLVFAPDETLYISTGERGDRFRAQDLADHAGKILRIRDDGSVPMDNPFALSGTSKAVPEALPEIFTYGHRNVQGLAVHPDTGRIWAHEHGPRGGDEVNVLKAGANYGWPVVTFGKEYVGGSIGEGTSKPGIEPPLLHWTPSIAPSGMVFYTGEKFPAWKGSLFSGALAGRQLRRVVFDDTRVVHEEVLLEGEIGRIRDVRQSPEGDLYLVTDGRNGVLYRLEPEL